MIKLYQFPPLWGLPNVSPFCLKMETYLRMAKLPFEAHISLNLKKAPKYKFPYIDDQGKKIGDTGFIVDYLKQQYGDSLDSHLTQEQLAHSLALHRMMEEHLYWALVYSRWIDPLGWPETKAAFFSKIPMLLKKVVPAMVQKNMRKALYFQGMGRHTSEEIYTLGNADIKVLSEILGDKLFFLGDKPCSLDATAYAFIANILYCPIESPLKFFAKQFSNLDEFCQRIKQQYYAT